MHEILIRQIKKFFGSPEKIPKERLDFIQAINKTYKGFSEEVELAQRSLDINSAELEANNKKLREEVKKTQYRALELEKMNNAMVDRELKMIQLKKELSELRNKTVEQ
jgi:hypothetical protein